MILLYNSDFQILPDFGENLADTFWELLGFLQYWLLYFIIVADYIKYWLL